MEVMSRDSLYSKLWRDLSNFMRLIHHFLLVICILSKLDKLPTCQIDVHWARMSKIPHVAEYFNV